MVAIPVRPKTWEMQFAGLEGGRFKLYPKWMHKEGFEPVLVHDTAGEEEVREQGYDNMTAAAMSNRFLINWFWDLEDMSAKQLVVFAKDEYGIDLPLEAGQEKLFRSVLELVRHAPQNQNRMVLMAHVVQMNYDATIEEIKRMIKPGALGVASEVETFEVVM